VPPGHHGEGIGWAATGLVQASSSASPLSRSAAPSAWNVGMAHLLVVVVTAAIGGGTAGLWTAVAAALSYDFFLTTGRQPRPVGDRQPSLPADGGGSAASASLPADQLG
jgi:K+-sensing histidine kinase KdpD